MTTRRAALAILASLVAVSCDDGTGPDVDPVTFEVVGRGEVPERWTTDLWVHGDWAYTGSWGSRSRNGIRTSGNALKIWDVSDPTSPRLDGTLVVDARTVNDVKISADGTLGVITHELSDDGLNGLTILDLSDPSSPVELVRYTDGLTTGVHNIWIDGNHLYVVVDGIGQGLRILDISDPSAPVDIASFYAGTSFLHDVYVRDGLAFLSHWDAGLVVLDVGNGMAGGSPSAPVEVSRIELDGETHNAWYWPDGGYVFVGEEDYGTPGILHVVDVSDMTAPQEVATVEIPGATSPPHNFWMDEDRGILYAAWYEYGLHAIDVTGGLAGSLGQSRTMGSIAYDDVVPNGCFGSRGTCTWAPQLEGGLLFAADKRHGLVVLEPTLP